MTLSSLLLPTPDYSPSQPHMNFPEVDRTEWNKGGWGGGGGGGGWKGGKGNNLSMNALTLLAFLFFLNILQNCLKETINATPTMMVMMMTSTEATTRKKRDLGMGEQDKKTSELHEQAPSNLTDTQIMNFVNDHVETYWSRDNARSKYTLIDASEVHQTNLNQSPKAKKKMETLSIPQKISTIKKIEDKIKGHKYKQEYYDQNFKSKIKNGSYGMIQKENSYKIFFMDIVRKIYEKLDLENMLCCNFVACMSKRFQRQLQDISPGINKVIKNTISRICSEPEPETCQSDLRLKCQSPLARSLINFVGSYFGTIFHKYNEK